MTLGYGRNVDRMSDPEFAALKAQVDEIRERGRHDIDVLKLRFAEQNERMKAQGQEWASTRPHSDELESQWDATLRAIITLGRSISERSLASRRELVTAPPELLRVALSKRAAKSAMKRRIGAMTRYLEEGNRGLRSDLDDYDVVIGQQRALLEQVSTSRD